MVCSQPLSAWQLRLVPAGRVPARPGACPQFAAPGRPRRRASHPGGLDRRCAGRRPPACWPHDRAVSTLPAQLALQPCPWRPAHAELSELVEMTGVMRALLRQLASRVSAQPCEALPVSRVMAALCVACLAALHMLLLWNAVTVLDLIVPCRRRGRWYRWWPRWWSWSGR
jgi:hypothetical protein